MNLGVKPRTESEPLAEKICGALSVVLRNGVDIHRCLAAQALGRIGDSQAVEPLIEALLDEDEDVRTDVAGALSTLVDPRASRQLLENLLGDPCTDVKLAAIDALVKLRDSDVVPWLRRLIKGRDEDIVWDESEFYESGWDDWVDVQVKAINGLAEMGIAEAIPDIIEAMEDENAQDLSETVFKALSRLGEPGVDALAGFLVDRDERRRRRAVAALTGVKGEKAGRLLTEALNDPAPMVRLAALRALAGRDPSRSGLASVFEDENAEVRAEAVRLCGTAHPDRLPALADDEAPDVQKAVMGVLIEWPGFGDTGELTALLRPKLDNPDPHLASAAAMALAAVAPQKSLNDLIVLLANTKRPVEARLGALRGLSRINNEPAVASIIGVIADQERPLRVEAMAALAAIARADATWPNAAGEALLKALRGEWAGKDEDAEETAADLRAPPGDASEEETVEADDSYPTSTLHSILGAHPGAAEILELPDEGVELTPADMERLALAKRIKGKKYLPVVPKVAPHQDIRRFAARVLGDLTHAAVADALAEAISDDDKDVRRAAADSLARLGAQTQGLPAAVTDALLMALNDADRDLRLSAVRALGSTGDVRITDVLRSCLEDNDSFVRTEAVRALSGMGEAGPGLKALLGDSDPGVRLAAAEAVAASGGEGSVERLVGFAFTFDGYHRREVGRVLRSLDAPLASTRFLEALDDDARTRTWPVAIEALEELNRRDHAADGPSTMQVKN